MSNKDKSEEIKDNKAEQDVQEEQVESKEELESSEEQQEQDEEQEEEDSKQDELAEMKDKHIRLYSEFENFRRRTAKERIELIRSANADLIKDLLPVLDDFERAHSSAIEEDSTLSEGFNLIFQKFKKTLEKHNLKEMEVKQGDDFDSDFHEAISQFPAEDEKLKGKVFDVVEKGYLIDETVIRFAKVVVGS